MKKEKQTESEVPLKKGETVITTTDLKIMT